MDLALEMGMTQRGLECVMSERELGRWVQYRSRRMLPSRRLEMMLARVCLTVAQALGGNRDATLGDFLFDPSDDGDGTGSGDAEPSAEDIAAQFGSTPYRKKAQG